MDLRREQDLEYLQSLLIDQTAEVHATRNHQRQLMTQLLQTKLPHLIMDLLSPDEVKLLRLPVRFLSAQDQEMVRRLKEEIARLDAGGCMDGANEATLFKVKIPNIATTLCFDVIDLFEQGLVNTQVGLADVNIALDETGELYRYPLNPVESRALIEKAHQDGIDSSQYPILRFPDLEETMSQIEAIFVE